MTLRTGHGAGAGAPRIEVLPVDELPEGTPALARSESPTDRGEGGRFARGNVVAVEGGRSRAGQTRLASRLGLSRLSSDPTFEPYRRAAEAFRRAQITELARSVGGGYCGPAPSSVVASAALQLAASRFLFDTASGDPDKLAASSRLANDSRQNLLAAHELCAREAAARPPSDPHEAIRKAFGLGEPK